MKFQGIYQIKNIINGKAYIGQVNFKRGNIVRWREHRSLLNENLHYNNHLQHAWNKHGEKNFIFEMIEVVENKAILDEREKYWIDKTIDNQYNIQKFVKSFLGVKKTLSEKAKINIANANKARPWTKQDRKKQSLALTGIKRNEEFKLNIKNRQIGSKHLEETKKKISEKHKNKFVSESTRNKIAQKATGRVKTEDEIEKRNDKVRLINKNPNKYKGVKKRKGNTWQARISYKRKVYNLGSFYSAEEAAQNFDYYAIKFFGKKTYLNFPEKNYINFVPKCKIIHAYG